MSITTFFAAVPVPDTEEAEGWYTSLLGRPADDHPMDGLVEWHTGGGGLQLALDPDRAGGGLVTVVVEDLHAFVATSAENGVTTDPVDGTTSDAVLFVVVIDPYGNSISLVQPRAT